MKPLVISSSPPPDFTKSGFSDLALYSSNFRFVWGPPPSQDELAAHLGPRTPSRDGAGGVMHWSEWVRWSQSENRKYRNLSVADLCRLYETVELWLDVRHEAQLELIWLPDYFRDYPKAVTKLKLRLVDRNMIWLGSDGIRGGRAPIVDVTEKETATATARAAWQAYRSPTPEACVDLLHQDLSALPLFKPVLLDLLAELPSPSSGLGASEMRMLEMIGRGYSLANDLFYNYDVRGTNAFSEYGYLLDGLAFGPTPAVAGLNEELRTMRRDNLRDRVPAYQRSRLSLTDFGKAVIAHEEDFSRHNPIDRWWGGTHLTNDNLWRWNPALVKP